MHQILSSPEILTRIFSYSTGYTNTITAQICQLWFTHSIRFIWDTVDFNDAIRLLSSFDDDGFQQPLNLHSWDRFFLYSKYVRCLECPKVNYAALRRMLSSQPSTNPLFSTLTRFIWKGVDEQIECLLPLLSSTLQALDISLDVITGWTADILCKAIGNHSPYLRVFEFNTPPTARNHRAISSALCELMSRLSQLLLLFIPVHFMTPELLRDISRLPNLENLKIFKWKLNRLDYTSNVEEALQRKLSVAKGKTGEFLPFYSLRDCYIIDEPYFRSSRVLERAIQLPKLVHLTCSPYGKPHLEEIVATMESIHIICPYLQTIKIDINSYKPSTMRLPWQAVKPLLKCPHLHTLIVHRQIYDMVSDDLTAVATDRPSWEVVILLSVNTFSYQALIPFAQNCPHLVELGLTLGKDEELPSRGKTEGAHFSSLTTLNVGRSAVTFPIQVGKFLASICRNTLEIQTSNNRKFTSSWRIVEEIVNTIVTRDPEEYYKQIPLSEDSDSETTSVGEGQF